MTPAVMLLTSNIGQVHMFRRAQAGSLVVALVDVGLRELELILDDLDRHAVGGAAFEQPPLP